MPPFKFLTCTTTRRDKWPGCFKVRWHIVKDIPNTMLRHIQLVTSDKKPVTNSRDTQEVEPGQGMLMRAIDSIPPFLHQFIHPSIHPSIDSNHPIILR